MNFREKYTNWEERYRPLTLSDCILPEKIERAAKSMLANGIENYAFIGEPGTGKTTLAQVLCRELKVDFTLWNASMPNSTYHEAGTAGLANLIESMANSNYGSKEKYKVAIIDEFDGISGGVSDAAFNSLRGYTEAFPNVKIIFTANHGNRFPAAIYSRFSSLKFDYPNKDGDESKPIMKQFYDRIISILDNEGVKYEGEENTIKNFIKKFYPSWRDIVREMDIHQRNNNKIITMSLLDREKWLDSIFNLVEKGDIEQCRNLILENNIEISYLALKSYDYFKGKIDTKHLPKFALNLHDQVAKSKNVMYSELSLLAFLSFLHLFYEGAKIKG